MKSARPIALWLAAVIVTIAAALMPSGAQAHGAHGRAPQAQPAVSASSSEAAVVAVEARLAGPSAIVRTDIVPVIETARIACACAACLAGGACGHAPSSCCATGLAPSPNPLLAPPSPRDRAPTCDGPRLSGIVPDTQIEPPRPLA